jgi:hypothetical protein
MIWRPPDKYPSPISTTCAGTWTLLIIFVCKFTVEKRKLVRGGPLSKDPRKVRSHSV